MRCAPRGRTAGRSNSVSQAPTACTPGCRSNVEVGMHVPQVRHTATHSWHGLAGLWQTALLMCVLQTCQSATAETGSADVQALKPISNLLLPPTTSDDVSQTDNWTLPDVCGSDGCGVSACTSYEPYVAPKPCNWGGICCLNWNVVGITLLPRDAMSFSLSTVMDAVSKLDNLTVLRMPQQG